MMQRLIVYILACCIGVAGAVIFFDKGVELSWVPWILYGVMFSVTVQLTSSVTILRELFLLAVSLSLQIIAERLNGDIFSSLMACWVLYILWLLSEEKRDEE